MNESDIMEQLAKDNEFLREELNKLKKQIEKAEKRQIPYSILIALIIVASLLINSRISFYQGYSQGSWQWKQKACQLQYKDSENYQKCLDSDY